MRDVFEKTERDFKILVEKFNCPGSKMWLHIVESELVNDSRELTRNLFQAHVNSRGIGYIGKSLKTKTNSLLTHKRLLKRNLNTLFGRIIIKRVGYSSREHHTVFPFDALLNLPNSSFSYGLQRFVARRTATLSFSEVLKLVKELTGTKIGSKQVVQIVEYCTKYFDEFYNNIDYNVLDFNKKLNNLEQIEKISSKNPDKIVNKKKLSNKNSKILVLTTDAKGIVMRQESLRKETRKRAEISKNKMSKRLSKGEKSNRKRMAQVASVYFIESFPRNPYDIIDDLRKKKKNKKRPRPIQKRVWASLEQSSDEVITAMFNDALKRDPQKNNSWVVLIDGNKHQLDVVENLSKIHEVKTTIILDIIHVIEYLWTASRALIDEKRHSECQAWVEEKIIEILNNNAGRVAGGIRISSSKLRISKAKKKAAEDCAQYISNHKEYMNYKDYLKYGFPIATGVIEGACRHLIKDRMDITGARWTLSGAESVLKLRALVSSNDFEKYWEFYLKNEFEKNYNNVIKDLDKIKILRKKSVKSS
jgi:hypothetical protein